MRENLTLWSSKQDQDGRPNTAATSQTDRANWDDIWRDVQSNVKRNNDDAQTAMKRFKSDGGRRAAMLISILDPMTKEQLDEIERRSSQNSQSDYKIETEKLIINEGTKDEREVELTPTPSSLFEKLLPCDEPPTSGDEFEKLVRETVVNVWKIWDHYLETDPQAEELYTQKAGSCNNDVEQLLKLKFSIIDASVLNRRQLIHVQENVKEIEDYSCMEILALWLASDEIVESIGCGRYPRRAWLQDHPYPIGRKDMPAGSPSRSDKLKTFYKHPNVILALYLHHIISSFRNKCLKAFKTALGLRGYGYHWLVLSRTGTSKQDVGIPGVDSDFFRSIHIAGLANSVVCGYHDIITDDNATYEIKDITYPLGYEYLISDRADTNHLICFTKECLNGIVCANMCIALLGNLSVSDVQVNVGVSTFLPSFWCHFSYSPN